MAIRYSLHQLSCKREMIGRACYVIDFASASYHSVQIVWAGGGHVFFIRGDGRYIFCRFVLLHFPFVGDEHVARTIFICAGEKNKVSAIFVEVVDILLCITQYINHIFQELCILYFFNRDKKKQTLCIYVCVWFLKNVYQYRFV